jgi:putative addiction module component (TIGR02574 family)
LPRAGRRAYVPGMSKFSAADALALPVPERLQLVEDIWNSIADAPQALELTEEDKRLIDERLEARRRNPNAGSPWAEVCARITARRK